MKPGDEVEYTIYFLNSENLATNVAVCDPVPANLTFVANGYNSAVPHSVAAGALPSETGIALGLDDTTLPTSSTVYLTNVNDSDRGRYYPPNDSQTPSVCASNTNGAVVVNVVTGTTTLPNATTPGTPANSYGFIRFKVKVK